MKLSKKSQTSGIQLIARNPPSLLIAGGVLLYLVGEQSVAGVLIFLGVLLQVLYLLRGRLF